MPQIVPHRSIRQRLTSCEIVAGVTARGNLVPDAHLAAMMRVHDIRTIIYTRPGFSEVRVLESHRPGRLITAG